MRSTTIVVSSSWISTRPAALILASFGVSPLWSRACWELQPQLLHDAVRNIAIAAENTRFNAFFMILKFMNQN